MVKRKYRFLTNNFFNGSTKLQINSVFRDIEDKPEKVMEFRRAIKDGDCIINLNELTKHQIDKIIELRVFGVLLELKEIEDKKDDLWSFD
jgi:hypothetical protein